MGLDRLAQPLPKAVRPRDVAPSGLVRLRRGTAATTGLSHQSAPAHDPGSYGRRWDTAPGIASKATPEMVTPTFARIARSRLPMASASSAFAVAKSRQHLYASLPRSSSTGGRITWSRSAGFTASTTEPQEHAFTLACTCHTAKDRQGQPGLIPGVLLDAFIVRLTLIPSLMTTFGAANWYLPNWLSRVLPRVSVESEDIEAGASEIEDTVEAEGVEWPTRA